jgi:hypothetical protein
MDTLTFKNYPAKALSIIFCLIVALNFLFQLLWSLIWKQEDVTLLKQLTTIAGSSGLVVGIMAFVNKKVSWNFFFKQLGIYNISGTYLGQTISGTFHENDNAKKAQMKRFCKVVIIQNLNGFRVSGDFYSDERLTQRTSSFVSAWEELKKTESGDFEIRYSFLNTGNLTHPDHAKYGLTTHHGTVILTFFPQSRTFKGYYFTLERGSNGEMNLSYQQQ